MHPWNEDKFGSKKKRMQSMNSSYRVGLHASSEPEQQIHMMAQDSPRQGRGEKPISEIEMNRFMALTEDIPDDERDAALIDSDLSNDSSLADDDETTSDPEAADPEDDDTSFIEAPDSQEDDTGEYEMSSTPPTEDITSDADQEPECPATTPGEGEELPTAEQAFEDLVQEHGWTEEEVQHWRPQARAIAKAMERNQKDGELSIFVAEEDPEEPHVLNC
jgi:hypothetical protein